MCSPDRFLRRIESRLKFGSKVLQLACDLWVGAERSQHCYEHDKNLLPMALLQQRSPETLRECVGKRTA